MRSGQKTTSASMPAARNLRSTDSVVLGYTVDRRTTSDPSRRCGISSSITRSKMRTDGFMNSSIGVPMTRMTVSVRSSNDGLAANSSRPVGSSLLRSSSAPVSRKGTLPDLTCSILAASMSSMPTR